MWPKKKKKHSQYWDWDGGLNASRGCIKAAMLENVWRHQCPSQIYSDGRCHYALEATPTKMKSTGRSEGCSYILMTSPVTKKKFKIGPLGDFEKTYVLYVTMAEKPLSSGQKWFPRWVFLGFVKSARIAISRKWHFRSPKRKNENTLQYKVPPKTWENSPQKPLLATRKWFFGHCYVQNVRFLKIP